MVNVLITGANSFVGKNYIACSPQNKVAEISLFDINPTYIDFTGYDVVLHLAAIVHQSKAISESEYYRVNCYLTIEVAKHAKKNGVKQFVFLSTVKVYGEFNPKSGPWTETSTCQPDDPYGKSKYEAERKLLKLADKDFTVSIVRTPLVYGNGVRANMLSIMKLVDRLKFLPFGNVNNKRSFTYVKNLVGFIDRIIEKRASGIYLAMDSKPLSTTTLVKLIANNLGKKIFLIPVPYFIIYFGKRILPKIFERLYGSFEMENSITLEKLEYEPQYSSEEGIREMVNAYLNEKESLR